MIDVKNLIVNYGNISALRGIDFQVKNNEIVSLIGANGAGKTTSLMAISGLVPKESGKIIFNDEDITNVIADKIVKKGIAHVPEGRHVFPKLTVEENLIMGTIGNSKIKKTEMDLKIEEMYKLFPRLKERYKQQAGTLSGGEQQMVAIARGLMSDPLLIMLDEPSLGLAPIVVEEIFELILRIKASGKTVLLIEQNANMALQISDRGYVLENGSIALTGTGASLLKDENVKKAYLGD